MLRPWPGAADHKPGEPGRGTQQSHLIDWLETCHRRNAFKWKYFIVNVSGVMVTGDLPEDGQPRHGGRHQAWELRPSLWQRESVIDASRDTSQCQKMFNRLSNNSNSKFQIAFWPAHVLTSSDHFRWVECRTLGAMSPARSRSHPRHPQPPGGRRGQVVQAGRGRERGGGPPQGPRHSLTQGGGWTGKIFCYCFHWPFC